VDVLGNLLLSYVITEESKRVPHVYTHKAHLFLNILPRAILQVLLLFSVTTAICFHRKTMLWTNADNSWELGLPWWLPSTKCMRHDTVICTNPEWRSWEWVEEAL